ncbi:MAG TPA: fructoselysine 6-kinase [Anaerolineaceae bacterium]|nr:fructoselysine 6-kinase [Anaerolineaceae bacterium]HPN51756.1 fructoselysine 6-kinase [Anaerolineaceae bacterium]
MTDLPLRVAAIGDNCMDVYPRLGRAYPTGNVVDFAVNMQRLGLPTAVISTTGSDDYGRLMRETLAGQGVDLSHFHTASGPTAVTLMDMNGRDRVHGDYLEGVLADMAFSEQDIAFAASHALVHTAFWGKAEAHLAALRAQGALISFDYATKKDSPLVAQTLPLVDFAFFSFAAAAQDEARAFLRQAQAAGPRMAVATFGSAGSLAYDGREFYPFGVFPAQVVNTVGAGDAFIAGFMHAHLTGQDVPGCLQAGARIAAAVVEVFEPWVTN